MSKELLVTRIPLRLFHKSFSSLQGWIPLRRTEEKPGSRRDGSTLLLLLEEESYCSCLGTSTMEWNREHATRKPPSRSCKERLVRRAIDELKGDTKGSSASAIKKQMQGGYSSRKWSNVSFLKALKAGVQCGDFIQTKQSYKLSALGSTISW